MNVTAQHPFVSRFNSWNWADDAKSPPIFQPFVVEPTLFSPLPVNGMFFFSSSICIPNLKDDSIGREIIA